MGCVCKQDLWEHEVAKQRGYILDFHGYLVLKSLRGGGTYNSLLIFVCGLLKSWLEIHYVANLFP